MRFDEIRAKRWLAHFGLLTDETTQWYHTHVSGHGSGDQIKRIIEGSAAKTIIPIHTEHEEYHKKWHNNVVEVNLNSSIELS
jgi:ribonuclease J